MRKRRMTAEQQRKLVLERLKPTPQEKLIQKLGEFFYKRRVEIPQDPLGRKSLLERGLIRRDKRSGKFVLTDKGMTEVAGRILAKLPKESVYSNKFERTYSPITYRNIFSVLKKKLGGFKGKKILELGFGGTGVLKELSKRGAVVSGLDKQSFKEVEGLNLVRGNIELLKAYFEGEKFDAIISKAVFEKGVEELNVARQIQSLEILKKLGVNTVPQEKLIERSISMLLEGIHEKLREGGYLIIQTNKPSFIKKQHLRRNGFEVISSSKKLWVGGYLTIARKR